MSVKIKRFVFVPLLVILSGAVYAQTISTFAGTNINIFFNGGAATTAQLYWPRDGKMDAAGNIYFADEENHVVRKLSTTGIITVVAGNGVAGMFGDGGPATAAMLNVPYDVSLDSSGNLYISDFFNFRIRKVSPSGIISTIAGTGVEGYYGDNGLATSAQLSQPYGTVVNKAGELIFSDQTYNHIRKIDTSGIITTIAGLYTSTLGGYSGDGGPAPLATILNPAGITIDTLGKLYFCDLNNYCVRTVDTNGIINLVAGVATSSGISGDGGPATSAHVGPVQDVAVDNSGNFFISDYINHKVRKINTAGIINTYAGTGSDGFSGDGGPAIAATFGGPSGLIVEPTGKLDIFDVTNNRIRQVSAAGIVTTIAGNAGFGGDGGNACLAQLQRPVDVCKDALGNIYVADTGNHTVRKINTSRIITTLAGTGHAGFSGSGGLATSALLNAPTGVACDPWGNVYIADMANNIVSVVTASGAINTFVGTGAADSTGDGGSALAATLNHPFGLAVDTSGNLYISDQGNNKIRMVNRISGLITTYAGNGVAGYSGNGGPATAAELNSPAYIAFDATNNLYIADYNNNVIRMVNSGTGQISDVFGNNVYGDTGIGGPATAAELCLPIGIAIDDSGGITTTVCGKIKHTPGGGTGGPVTVIAGNGRTGMTPDGTPSLASVFNGASGICYDGSGHLLIADANNRVVRGSGLPPLNSPDATAAKSRFTIRPNPNSGDFMISGYLGEQEKDKEIDVVISNLLGQQVYHAQMPVNNKFIADKIHFKDLPSGLYFCHFTGKEINETIQFLMQQ